MDLSSTAFWAGLGSIIIANILLSGDNAVVIALAARSLPAHQQKKAILFGSGAAIVLRIVLTLVAAAMLRLPFLKIIGGLLLLYIGVDLLGGDDEGEGELGKENGNLGSAVRTILVADLVMSLDNVLAVAAAAKGDTTLLVLGLAISIPLIVFGSTLLLGIMQRFPIIITLGAALLGFLAGEMVMTDPAVTERWADLPHIWANLAGVAGALLVVALGRWRHSRQAPVATDT
ncbi:MAG: TerC family protein [Betaproteobacteria bacterium]|jgi:YjbE family integral membrane protein|nr:TerC family protein [Betaproteobacteria bacterium]NBT11352.1 TerC family protein [Betaproteobacteria bacterium]NBU49664.1 TerC family protein [Betaproteobacteria bacterium]NBX96343.1 TerC family protein [Betaproteobacteria bacterium]